MEHPLPKSATVACGSGCDLPVTTSVELTSSVEVRPEAEGQILSEVEYFRPSSLVGFR